MYANKPDLRNASIKTLLLILTYKCNSKCKHCDIWKDQHDELSPEIVENIIKDPYVKSITHIELSGGEPFLWRNIGKIIESIENTLDTNIGISTNGLLTEKIIEFIGNIKGKNRLTVRLSLDGLEGTNDIQRCVKGAFKKTLDTAKKIKSLYPEVQIEFLFTITKDNHKEILCLYDLLKKINPTYKFTIGINQYVKNYKTKLRKHSLDEYSFTSDEIKEIKKQLKPIYQQYAKDNELQEALFIKEILRYLNKEPSKLYCSSPTEGLIILPDKKIHACINEEPVGVLTNKGILESINHKKREQQIQKALKKECSQCVLRLGRYPSLYRFTDSFNKN